MRAPGSAEKLYEQVSRGAIDILIGTQMILKGPALPKLALVGMIDADSLLAFADFRADEKLLHILTRAAKQTSLINGHRPGKVFVQTFHPESAFFQRIASLDAAAFFKQILAEREDLFYPPFSRLIALVCQGKTEAETDTAAAMLHTSLTALLPKNNRQYRLSTPQAAKKQGLRKIFASTLLLRIPENQPLPEKTALFLRTNNTVSIIDVDPLSFI